MSPQRRVTIGAGQTMLVRLLNNAPAGPGMVAVSHRSRGKMQIPASAWQQGVPA
jgi:hypothetical protein